MTVISPSGSLPAYPRAAGTEPADIGSRDPAPAFGSLLMRGAGDEAAAPLVQSIPQFAPGHLAPPAEAFDALGMFGHMDRLLVSGDTVDDATTSLPADAAGAETDSAIEDVNDSPIGMQSARPSTRSNALVASAKDVPSPRREATSELPSRLPAPVPRSAALMPDPIAPNEDEMTVPSRPTGTVPLRQTRREPTPVSLTVAGEDDQALQIIARADGGDPDERDMLHRVLEQVANELGMSVEGLHLDGIPMNRSHFAIGEQHGR